MSGRHGGEMRRYSLNQWIHAHTKGTNNKSCLNLSWPARSLLSRRAGGEVSSKKIMMREDMITGRSPREGRGGGS